MKLTVDWHAHLNTKKEEKIPTLLKQIEKILDQPITELEREIYYKDNNWRVAFTTQSSAIQWDSFVLETIRLAQKLAYHWNLLGNCDTNLEGIASEQFRLSGVLWLHWWISRAESNS